MPALADVRVAADDRPALVVLASRLGELGTPPAPPPAGGVSLRQARDDWLRRLEASRKSKSAIVAYRVAIDDLLKWAGATGRNVLEKATTVDYLRSYHPSSARSNGATSSSTDGGARGSSVTARAASLDVNRCGLASPMSC